MSSESVAVRAVRMRTLSPPIGAPWGQKVEPAAFALRPGSIFVTIVFVFDLSIVALSLGVGLFVGAATYAGSSVPFEESSSADLLWANGAIILVTLGFIPALWVFFSRARPWIGGLQYLGFTKPLGHASFVGVGLAGCMLGGALALLAVLSLLLPSGGSAGGNLEALYAGVSWPLVFFLSFAAGFGEEIFFRGVLYRWLGWWGQAPIFALAHFAGGEPLQLVVTLTVGLLFGWLRHIGWSLWTLIIAHTVYDFCLLGGALYLQQ